MANKQTRRDFVKCAISAAAGASAAMSMEERALLARAGAAESQAQSPAALAVVTGDS